MHLFVILKILSILTKQQRQENKLFLKVFWLKEIQSKPSLSPEIKRGIQNYLTESAK